MERKENEPYLSSLFIEVNSSIGSKVSIWAGIEDQHQISTGCRKCLFEAMERNKKCHEPWEGEEAVKGKEEEQLEHGW